MEYHLVLFSFGCLEGASGVVKKDSLPVTSLPPSYITLKFQLFKIMFYIFQEFSFLLCFHYTTTALL